MKLAMCNEFCQGWPLEQALDLAADVGFTGIEIAPFTLAADVRDIGPDTRRNWRAAAQRRGVDIVGLHWLLVSPEGLHLSHPDAEIRRRTQGYLAALVQLCADLGGSKVVFGSPKQRNVPDGLTFEQAWTYALETIGSLCELLEFCAVDLCIEPLSRHETTFINTAAEGIRFCRAIGHPRVRLHLDVKAMCAEDRPLDEIIRSSRGYLGHFHANDANRSYPGSGATDYTPIVHALREIGYNEWVSVEVFDFAPGPRTIAAASYAYLRTAFGD